MPTHADPPQHPAPLVGGLGFGIVKVPLTAENVVPAGGAVITAPLQIGCVFDVIFELVVFEAAALNIGVCRRPLILVGAASRIASPSCS